MRVAFISESLPPAQTGQAVVLRRLLEGRGASDYCLVSAADWGGEGQSRNTLPGKTYALGGPFRFERGYRFGLARLRETLNVPLGVRQRARQFAEIIGREACDAVVACTGDVLDLPAACLAARRAGVPFYAYLFDHYSYREWRDPARRFWARRFEPWVLRNAAAVIAPNEVLRDDLRARFGVEAAVIHNSFDISPYAGPDDGPHEAAGGVVYTGDIYEAHYDAFRNLLDALDRLGRGGLKLHAYTPRTEGELAEQGLRGRMVLHAPRDPSEIPGVQRGAGALFLPLAFNSPYPELVRTSATTKMGEYLAARRPVIAHAPPDSFVAWYFREHECGVVVDRLDPAQLAEAVARVLDDEALGRRLARRGWERAAADFDIGVAREKFWTLLGEGARSARVAAGGARVGGR
ncbi:MAG TPA: glycosyltransferase [Pyrinomonadaceae bacterium]|jgi:glycosyltransferase involved in cell wall biosynthesis|nr:glycosyltransferase [Pyrinomonadaceae bacterium]